MDSACPEKDVTEILSDSDHSTKVALSALSLLQISKKATANSASKRS